MLDWRRYDQPYNRHKTALPTYPFQRQRFWPDMLREAGTETTKVTATNVLTANNITTNVGAINVIGATQPQAMTAALGRVEWQAASWPRQAGLRTGRWLLLADAGGIAEALAERLRGAGAEVVMARPGSPSRNDGGCWRVAPGDGAGWRRLLAGAAPLAGIVHLWSLDWPADPARDELERILHYGIEPIVAIARHRMERAASDAVPAAPVWIVTAGAVGPGVRRPAAASLWGLSRVQLAEQPELLGGIIDVEATSGADDADVLLRFMSVPPAGDRVAIRNGVRMTERLVHVFASSTPPKLNPDAAYLVTGGLGALGQAVARALARWGARRLLLQARRPDQKAARAIVEELETVGVAVEIRACDVADAEALAGLFAEIDAKGWVLGGVVHAAGVLDDGLIATQTTERVRGVLAPKVTGAINLHRLTRDRRLDFLVLFSSIASIAGGVGQGSYAAANTFLDALAEYRQQRGLAACSIQWGPWASGMGTRLAADKLASTALRALTVEEGTRLLAVVLARGEPALVAVAADWKRITAPPARAGNASAAAPAAPRLAGLDRADAAERRAVLAAYVDRVIRRVLLWPEPEPISAQRSLLDLGLDSMGATDMRNRITADTGVELPIHLLLSGASQEQLAEALSNRFALSRMTSSALPASDDRSEIEEYVL